MIETFEFFCIIIGFRGNSHAGEGPRHLLPKISIGSTAVNITLKRLQRPLSKALLGTRCTDRSQAAKHFALRETAILSGNDKTTIRKILPSPDTPKQCSLLPPSHPTNSHTSLPAHRSRETRRFQDFLSPFPLPPSLSSLGTPKATYPEVPTHAFPSPIATFTTALSGRLPREATASYARSWCRRGIVPRADFVLWLVCDDLGPAK